MLDTRARRQGQGRRPPVWSRSPVWSRLAVAGLILACSTTVGHAADWWSVSDGANGIRISSDPQSLACAGDICSIREDTVYPKAKPDGTVRQEDVADYDCINRETRTRTEVSYDRTGAVLRSVTSPPSPWQPVATGTVGDATFTFACYFRALSDAAGPAPMIRVAGLTFVRQADLGALVRQAPSTPGTAPRAPARTSPAAPKAAQAGAPDGGGAVQIVAAPSLASARQALAALGRRWPEMMAGRSTTIEPVTRGGATLYRALIKGFPSRSSAAVFCAALRATSQACIVR